MSGSVSLNKNRALTPRDKQYHYGNRDIIGAPLANVMQLLYRTLKANFDVSCVEVYYIE
ncbi:hypothetical protein [Streptococcus hillyeri]|uniref:hypothetical protein n=1 Tax=Streptococcus hillyeri TaxID=2282420 RepID=UPI001C7CEF19|nr:hypothetical protein [Streptococcus hillyeri]